MRFIKAADGTAVNVEQIIQVGSANTIRGSRSFDDYLMVSLPNGRTAVPVTDTGTAWATERLDEFLAMIQGSLLLS
jgi:hypothetical protein